MRFAGPEDLQGAKAAASDRATLRGLVLIRLFQHATICSVMGRAAPAISEEFARVSAAIRHGESLPRSTWRRVAGPTASGVLAASIAGRIQSRTDGGSVPRADTQVSLTAGTILHNTKTPLTVWFWAAYLAVTDKRGLSALLLQRQLGLTRNETAWMLLHKLRRAMVNAAREPLHDDVEMDDTWVGGPQPGLRGSRQLKGRKAALVLVAVEKRGDVSGRVRMAALLDLKEATVQAFVKQHIAPGSTLYTDAYKSFDRLSATGVRHVPRHQASRMEFRRGAVSVVPLADKAIGNLQQWLIGTYHGVSKAQLQVYLDEFVFRHNCCRQPMAAFQTLLGLGSGRLPTPYRRIRGARDLIER